MCVCVCVCVCVSIDNERQQVISKADLTMLRAGFGEFAVDALTFQQVGVGAGRRWTALTVQLALCLSVCLSLSGLRFSGILSPPLPLNRQFTANQIDHLVALLSLWKPPKMVSFF